MKHSTGTIQTADGLNLYTEAWLPEGNPRAAVLIVHGIAEHIGRYRHVAEYLAGHGYAVYGIDHRTHGKSEGEPRVYIKDFNRPVDDLKRYLDTIKANHPDKPVFIYGHSMGSLIATLFVLRYQDQLAGFVSSGSPLTLDSMFSRAVLVTGRLLNRVVPTLPMVKLNLDSISRDPAVVKAYVTDPLVHAGRMRVGMAANGNDLIEPLRQRLTEITLPLFIIHGGEDRTTPVSGSQLLYERASSADKTLEIFPGLYHEVHNEPEKEMVLADIVGWLSDHCPSTKE